MEDRFFKSYNSIDLSNYNLEQSQSNPKNSNLT